MKKSKLVIFTACLLMATPSVALAAKSGSKSESASAAWLVDGIDTSCLGGTSPANLTDSVVNNDDAYVWIKSSSSVDEEEISWMSYDKGRFLQSGDLDYVSSCGQFRLMAFDIGDNEDLDYSNNLNGTGSITFKFDYYEKNFSSDTATLY